MGKGKENIIKKFDIDHFCNKKENWKFKAFVSNRNRLSVPKLLLSKSTETVYYNKSIYRITVSSQKRTHTHLSVRTHVRNPPNTHTTYAFVCSHSHVQIQTNLIFTLLKFKQTREKEQQANELDSQRIHIRCENCTSRTNDEPLGCKLIFPRNFSIFINKPDRATDVFSDVLCHSNCSTMQCNAHCSWVCDDDDDDDDNDNDNNASGGWIWLHLL